MPSKASLERKAKMEEEAAIEKEKSRTGKQNSGGEASKRAKEMSTLDRQQHNLDIAEGQDNRKGNIGPSGQGGHRGKEARNRQSSASGRPDHSAASPGAPMSGN